ncbi:MAG TPA: helix-hairpin-helix domain-containing protein [Nitrospirales bacterium]|nr:helix-hairpin-helix domain-containing protein [Nitrospirales bacterium]
MNRWLVISVVLLLGLPGCMVSKSKYEASVADMESAKAELEKSRMHQEALEEQIRNLKGLNEKVSTDLETMTTEVQRIKEGRKNEHTLLETRERELDQEKEQLTSKLRVVVDQYQKVKAQNKALKETVLRYQKELKDTRESSIGGGAGAMKSSEKPEMSKTESAPSVNSSAIISSKPPVPKIVTPPTLPKIGGDLVNINKAPVSDLVLTLGLTREVAEEVVSNRPYRLRGELVAKNIIPKATFDEIKDRITASP